MTDESWLEQRLWEIWKKHHDFGEQLYEEKALKKIQETFSQLVRECVGEKEREHKFDGRTHQAKHQYWVRGFNDAKNSITEAFRKRGVKV